MQQAPHIPANNNMRILYPPPPPWVSSKLRKIIKQVGADAADDKNIVWQMKLSFRIHTIIHTLQDYK